MKAKTLQFLSTVYNIPPRALWAIPGAYTYALITAVLLSNVLFKSSHMDGQMIVITIGQFEIVGIAIHLILSLIIWKFIFPELTMFDLSWVHFTISIVGLAFLSILLSLDTGSLLLLHQITSLCVGLVVFVYMSAQIPSAFYLAGEEKQKRNDG